MADKVTAPTKIVTDPVLLSALAKQGVDKDYVELYQDYASKSLGSEHSPYAKFYRDLIGGKRFAVVSGLPMVDAYGQKHELGWTDNAGVIENGNNIFHCVVNKSDVRLITLSDQPTGTKKNAELLYHPQLFLDGIEIKPVADASRRLDVDPINLTYQFNVLEWDYGVCLRRLRVIEGKILGSWVFPAKPTGEIRISYNQTGDYRLRLGQFAIDSDTEVIKPGDFDQLAQFSSYPVIISDTATFYPDASPESTTVDGQAGDNTDQATWAAMVATAGAFANDSATTMSVHIASYSPSPHWQRIIRSIILLSISLPANAVKIAATFSVSGQSKNDNAGWAIDMNAYSSNPTSNIALAAGDFAAAKMGTTPYSDTPITYAGFSIAGFNDLVFNATGLGVIPLSGILKLSLQNANYDVAERVSGSSSPTWIINKAQEMIFYTADQGGSDKPKLVVTYFLPGSRGSMASKLKAAGVI
ncbi:MAG: hypothetical protein Q8O55_01475 [Dehalococcoidales bacterium]|nr:hypothetical protein [Dehalococcoidales bacterium]